MASARSAAEGKQRKSQCLRVPRRRRPAGFLLSASAPSYSPHLGLLPGPQRALPLYPTAARAGAKVGGQSHRLTGAPTSRHSKTVCKSLS